MFYNLSDQNLANILVILNQADIKGSDSSKVIAIRKILSEPHEVDPDKFYKFSDELHQFLIDIIDNITVKGQFANHIVSLYVALGKSHKKLPSKLSKKKTKKPVGPPAPK